METSEFTKTLDNFIKRRTKTFPGWVRAKCEKVSPLIFSFIDGNAQAGEGKSIKLLFMHGLENYNWKAGIEAAAILSGNALLIMGVLDDVISRALTTPGWLRARCESLSPLVFSVINGNIRAGGGTGVDLALINGLASYEWKPGIEAAAILSGSGLLIMGAL